MNHLCLITLLSVPALCDSLCLPKHVHKKISDVGKFRRYAGENEDAVRRTMGRADAQPILDYRQTAGKSVPCASLNARVPIGPGFTDIKNFIGKKSPSTYVEDPKLVAMKKKLVNGNFPDDKLSLILQQLKNNYYNGSRINFTDGRLPYPESSKVNWHFNDLIDRSYLPRPQFQERRICKNGTRDSWEGIKRFEQNGPSADREDTTSDSTRDEPGFSSEPSPMSAGGKGSDGIVPSQVLNMRPRESGAKSDPSDSAFLTSEPPSATADSVKSARRLFDVIQSQNPLDLLNIPLLVNGFKIGTGDLKDALSRLDVPKEPFDNGRDPTRSCHPPAVTTQCTSRVENLGVDSLAKSHPERIRPGPSALVDGYRYLPQTDSRGGSIPSFLSPSVLDTPVLMIPLTNFHIESVVARPDNSFLPIENGSESPWEDLYRYMNYRMYLKLLNGKEPIDLTTKIDIINFPKIDIIDLPKGDSIDLSKGDSIDLPKVDTIDLSKVDRIDLPKVDWSGVLMGYTENPADYLQVNCQPSPKVSWCPGKQQDTCIDNLSRIPIGNRFSGKEKNQIHNEAMKSERFGTDSIFPLLKVAANLAVSKYSNKPKIESKLENTDEYNFKENFTRYRSGVERWKSFDDPISTRNYSEELIGTTPVSALGDATLQQAPSEKTFEFSTRNDRMGSFSESATETEDGAKATSTSYSTALESAANQFILKTLHSFENSFKSPVNQTKFNKTEPFYFSSSNKSDRGESFHLDPNRFEPLQVTLLEPWKRNGSNISNLLSSNVFNRDEKLPETNLSSSSDDRASRTYAMKTPQCLRNDIISHSDKFFTDLIWDDLSHKLDLLRDSSSYSNEDKSSYIGRVGGDSAFKEKDIVRESVASNVPVHPTPELNVPFDKIFDNEAELTRLDDIDKDSMDKVSGTHLYHCPRSPGNRRNAGTLSRIYDTKHYSQATPIEKEALGDSLNRYDKCMVSDKKCGYYSSNKSRYSKERMRDSFLRDKTGAVKIPAAVFKLANDAEATTRSYDGNRENDGRQVKGWQLPDSKSMVMSVSHTLEKEASTERSPIKNLLQPPTRQLQKNRTDNLVRIGTEKTAVEKVVVKGDGVNRGLGNTTTESEIISVISRRLADQRINESDAVEEKSFANKHPNTLANKFTDHRPLFIFALDSDSFENATGSKPKIVMKEIPVNLIIKQNGTDKAVPREGEPMASIAEGVRASCPTCKPDCGPTCRQVTLYPIYPFYPVYPIKPILSVGTPPSPCQPKNIVVS